MQKIKGILYNMFYISKILRRTKSTTWKKRIHSFGYLFKKLNQLGGMSHGNQIDVYKNQERILCNMINTINNAKFRILIETYTFSPDLVGARIRDALVEASKRGVEILFIYDHFGSSKMNNKFLKPLSEDEIRLFAFNPIWPWNRTGPLLFRDHRKIMIADDEISFCGSMNISLNPGRPFRETVLRIEGPAVWNLLKVFVESLFETAQKVLNHCEIEYQKYFFDGVITQVLSSNRHRDITSIQKSIRLSLKYAKRACYFTSPYFLPHGTLKKAIIDAAKRGIDVRILTAGEASDVPLMRLASCHIYGQFLEAGVRIYELQNQTLHAKTAAIDGVYAWVGSFNLDHWSDFRNLEVSVGVIDRCIAKKIEKHFKLDLKNSKEIFLNEWKKRSILTRLVHLLSYQIMKL